MARKNNKGFSVVEIVIAIAILSLLLVPIVTQISQTLKTSRMAKQQPYVTDDAVYLMEDFQKSSMDELELKYGAPAEKPETVECKIYNSSGTDTGKKVKYHAYRYTLSNVKMGPEQKEYSRVVILDDLDTALKGCNDGSNKGFKMAEATTAPSGFTLNSEGHAVKYDTNGYVESAVCDTTELVKNPNDVNLGNMQDMDSSKVAIVPGTSAKPARAALPVSPDVAVRITISLSMLFFLAAVVIRYGSIDRAISLNAIVLPWNSSKIYEPW